MNDLNDVRQQVHRGFCHICGWKSEPLLVPELAERAVMDHVALEHRERLGAIEKQVGRIGRQEFGAMVLRMMEPRLAKPKRQRRARKVQPGGFGL